MISMLTLATYNSNTIRIGDPVAEEVIDLFRNNQIPVTDWSTLFQAGGAICDCITEDGHIRPTFSTFKRNTDGIWTYCGNCLRSESIERGSVPAYQVL